VKEVSDYMGEMEILKALENCLSQQIVGENFKLARCNVADIWKNRQKITDAIASSESQAFSNKKKVRYLSA